MVRSHVGRWHDPCIEAVNFHAAKRHQKDISPIPGGRNIKEQFATVGMLLISASLHGDSVIGSRRDLGTPQVCEFCNAAHVVNAGAAVNGGSASADQPILLSGWGAGPAVQRLIRALTGWSEICRLE